MADFWGDYKPNAIIHHGSQSISDKDSKKKIT